MTSKRSSVTSSTMLMKVELRNSEREKDIMNYIINVFPSTMKSPHPPPKGIPPGLPKWKNDSNRRQKILNSGMLTPKGKAYRCVGEPIMDNEKLFISMLSNEDQKTLTGILQEVKKRLQLKKPLAQCLEEVSEAKVSAF